MQSAPLSEIEQEIIADIQAACRRYGWSTKVRPKFQTYLDRRGHFYEKQIKRLGGWKKLCALAGMQNTAKPALPVRRDATAPDFDTILADVRSVAQSLRLKPGAPLTLAVYHRSGGLHYQDAISNVGGWAKLSAAAGVLSRRGGNQPDPRHPWQKIRPALSERDLDAALNDALGRTPAPRGFLRMLGGKRGKGRSPVYRDLPELERGEVIADIRQVSLSVGLLSPRLLTFETYRSRGGRYTYEQTLTLGGFDTLRRVA